MSAVEPWGQFEHDPRVPANAVMRASDHDRSVISSILGDAFAEGRLTRNEYDERSDAVLATRTLGELLPLVSDLPAGRVVAPDSPTVLSATQKETQAMEAFRDARRTALWSFISASLICWVIWVATGIDGGLSNEFPWPLFVMLGTGLNVGRVVFQKEGILADEVRRLDKKERKAKEREGLNAKSLPPTPGEDSSRS